MAAAVKVGALSDYEANQVPVRTERVLPTLYVGMYAVRPNTECVPVFQSARNLVPIGILEESSRNVQPSVGSVDEDADKWVEPSMLGVDVVNQEQQFDRGARELFPLPSDCPLSEEWVLLDGDGGRWWLLLAKDRALAATARRDPTPNSQLLLIAVFLPRSTRCHEWLYPLKLKTVPGLWAEQQSGNCCCV